MSNPHDYTVGWICAIAAEYVAAQAFLDEKHEGPDYVATDDNNDYTLGRIGKHNVVIAVLPHGEYGFSSAATVGKDMLHSFPNVRIGLMVGIAGGAPSLKHDIRLGDIVVSASSIGKGGVLQHDFGKSVQGVKFEPIGFLNQPPQILRAAVYGLMAQYESDGHNIIQAIEEAIERKPRLRKKYSRPEANTDKLYLPSVLHPQDDNTVCTYSCSDNLPILQPRPTRTEDDHDPAVHYGLIASANQLIKDASVRDRLAAEKDILCFDIEAAGLMNHFPCLVIRGICDYADCHKNEEWQGYAAMSAAAYAKDLLLRIPPTAIEAEEKISSIQSGLLGTTQKQLAIREDAIKQSAEQRQCLQLFRLTESSKDTTYEWYKDRVEDRVEGTCQWFLNHNNLQEWSNQDSGPLLVSADPGYGKSVLAKYLIDQGLPRSSTIYNFFFKEQDQNKVRQALCALLYQLFSLKPSLIKHAMPHFQNDGQGLISSTQSLWTVLSNAVKDPQAGPITFVVDALDECAEPEFEILVRNPKNHLSTDHGELKYLLTSRPYENIVSRFRDRNLLMAFPILRIAGEEASEAISQGVNYVFMHRLKQLWEGKRLSQEVDSHFEKELQEPTNRTYLWVYPVLEYLGKENLKKTQMDIDSTIAKLPNSISDAYEHILCRTEEKDRRMIRNALSIMLAGRRPLTLSEMNIAMIMSSMSESIHDVDLKEEEAAMKYLVENGANIEADINAAIGPHQQLAKLLLGKGPDTDAKVGDYSHKKKGRATFLLPVQSGDETNVKLLLGNGVNKDCTEEDVQSPLSTEEENHEIVERPLLENRAVDYEEWTDYALDAGIKLAKSMSNLRMDNQSPYHRNDWRAGLQNRDRRALIPSATVSVLKQTLAKIYGKILKILCDLGFREPDVPLGHKRIRWKNGRGKWLYDDYIEHELGALDALQNYLNSSSYRSRTSPQGCQSQSSLRTTPVSSGSSLINFPQVSRTEFANNPDQARKPPYSNVRGSRFREDLEMCALAPNTLHILACIERGRYTVDYHSELVTDITNDRQLFQTLQKGYHEHRGKLRRYWSLRTIHSIQFMKFAYGGHRYIDVRCHNDICEHGKPCRCLPPPDLVRPQGSEYECCPVPSKLSPPVGARLMMDYFNSPNNIEPDSTLVLRQLPKRTCGDLKADYTEVVEAWGIYYKEDWDWKKIWLVMGIGFFPPSLFFGILWGILKEDVQTAFGVASWWMTGATIILGIVGTSTWKM